MKKIFACLYLFVALFAVQAHAQAQTPTIVYGASETAPGVADEYLLLQPENAGNPLGNPIVSTDNTTAENSTKENGLQNSDATDKQGVINQYAPQNPQPFSVSPGQEKKQIENTLYQGGNRIYDVQSFPLDDIKTITEPNVQPTITTYPEY